MFEKRRVEMVPRRNDRFPFAEVKWEDHDPLEAFTVEIAKADPDAGESTEIHFDLLPMAGRQWHRWKNLLITIGHIIRWFAELFGKHRSPPRADPKPMVEAERREEIRSLTSKVTTRDRMFAVQILVEVRAPSRDRANQLMDGVVTCFGQFKNRTTSGNEFKRRGINVLGLVFLGSDEIPWRRWLFDLRFRTGLFLFTGSTWALSATEIEWFMKPATKTVDRAFVERSGGRVPPPPIEMRRVSDDASFYLGELPDGKPVRVELKDTRFLLASGKTETGKSTIGNGLVLDCVPLKIGALDVDPHGTSVEELMDYLSGEVGRLCYLDVSPRAERIAAWNPLDMSGQKTTRELASRFQPLADAMAHVHGWNVANKRAITLTKFTFATLAEIGMAVPPECQPTIFQALTFFTDPTFQTAILAAKDKDGELIVSPTQQMYWQGFFGAKSESYRAEAVSAVTHVLNSLKLSPESRAMFGQPKTAYDAHRAMAERWIVLANTHCSSGEDARLIASMLVFDAYRAAKARVGELAPFLLIADEAPMLDNGTLGDIVQELRKYAVIAAVLTQDPTSLTADTLRKLGTNASHMITGKLGKEGAHWYRGQWGDAVTEDTIRELSLHHFLASLTINGETHRPTRMLSKPISLQHPELYELDKDKRATKREELERALDDKWDRKTPEEVEISLAGHDDLILETLAKKSEGKDRPRMGDSERWLSSV